MELPLAGVGCLTMYSTRCTPYVVRIVLTSVEHWLESLHGQIRRVLASARSSIPAHGALAVQDVNGLAHRTEAI